MIKAERVAKLFKLWPNTLDELQVICLSATGFGQGIGPGADILGRRFFGGSGLFSGCCLLCCGFLGGCFVGCCLL